MRKVILHLCADTGSDSWPYQLDTAYEVVKVGSEIGVENFSAVGMDVHGIIANPVCTQFSRVRRGRPGDNYPHVSDPAEGMLMVTECFRILREAKPQWWVMENPATGTLKDHIGTPRHTYQPWQYGSPWTKLTGLWGSFTMPAPTHERWEDVQQIPDLWVRPGRMKPSIVYAHKSAWDLIPEFRESGMPKPETDAELRSLCSQGFARAFKEANP